MDGSKIPQEGRLAYLCMMTGRPPQTARRWIDPLKPGLPDLESFARLCVRFESDANWLLGLTKSRYPSLSKSERSATGGDVETTADTHAWLAPIARDLAEAVAGCEPMRISGDDMEPRIRDGDLIFVDRRATEISANGTYVVEYNGRVMVRNIEIRIGEGLVLRCENPKYKESVLKDASAAKRMGLSVLGRVRASIGITRF